jgi:hypothetical protein
MPILLAGEIAEFSHEVSEIIQEIYSILCTMLEECISGKAI